MMPGKAQPQWTQPARRYERAEYRSVTDAVDLVLAAERIHFAPSVRRYLFAPEPPRSDARALDVGCGAGQGCLVLKHLGWRRLAGIDRDDCMDMNVRRAGVKFQRFAAEQYNPNAPFDLVTCCDALEHMTNPARILQRMVAWVAPKGILLVTLPLEGEITRNPYHLQSWNKARAQLLLAAHWRIVRDGVLGVNEYWAWLAPKGRLTWWELTGGFDPDDA